jgi:hypothetical protein
MIKLRIARSLSLSFQCSGDSLGNWNASTV